jgi:hypothetical protein
MKQALIVALIAACAPVPAYAFDVNGVALGAREADIRERFPSAYCKPLEWPSRAADRRCDDARIDFMATEARVTFFLRDGVVQGYDLRFAAKERPRVVGVLKSQWGPPAAETKDLIQRNGKPDREVYKMTWAKERDRATLVWRPDRKRCWLSVSRGDFAEEIYRVR